MLPRSRTFGLPGIMKGQILDSLSVTFRRVFDWAG